MNASNDEDGCIAEPFRGEFVAQPMIIFMYAPFLAYKNRTISFFHCKNIQQSIFQLDGIAVE
jgi:hypothetical protein